MPAAANGIRAVVILAEHEGKVILIDQPRVPLGGRCIELPAGLVGDTDPNATVETTAIKELEEETGFTAERVERLGDFYASPGMVVGKLHAGSRARRPADRRWRRRRAVRTSTSTSSPATTSPRSSSRSAREGYGDRRANC